MKVSAAVFVDMKVKVYVGDWGIEGSFESLQKQAKHEAVAKLQRIIGSNSGSVSIIGEPSVMSVVLKEEQ